MLFLNENLYIVPIYSIVKVHAVVCFLTFSLVLFQIGSYFGSELLSMDVDGDGLTDVLLVAAPMFYSQGWERGKVYIYTVTPQVHPMLLP